MLINTPEGEYKVVVEKNERKEEYLAVYEGVDVVAKVHASWQVAMVRKMEDLEAELKLAMVLEESHLRTIKEYSKENATIGNIQDIMSESVFKPSKVSRKEAVEEAIKNKLDNMKLEDIDVEVSFPAAVPKERRGGSELENYTDLSEYEDIK